MAGGRATTSNDDPILLWCVEVGWLGCWYTNKPPVISEEMATFGAEKHGHVVVSGHFSKFDEFGVLKSNF
ncbi:hypothetical protein TorRG33x02_045360 [Trema orientale]|uniref:Uncharacterized protein n=1 Tax=Trema orientale TaxID=63057 RepID=A0A2P5FPP3_TREOI|nr:hypothetical protein TorRG33x02_045360 [Trema orientale]